jgi:hypothetical protein
MDHLSASSVPFNKQTQYNAGDCQRTDADESDHDFSSSVRRITTLGGATIPTFTTPPTTLMIVTTASPILIDSSTRRDKTNTACPP